jgi:pSer/pThr/pTyr-binding forkhead associated (FHA) protein
VSQPNHDQTTDKGTGDATSAFRADFLGEFDTSADGAAQAEAWEEGSPSGSAMLVVKRGPNAGSRFWLDQPVTSAGRHHDRDIFLDDISVSRRHAEFRRENGEYLVVDTGSLNGTYVNREPAESVALTNGDEIQMGKFRLVFLTGPATH